jgi:hypothetical protein
MMARRPRYGFVAALVVAFTLVVASGLWIRSWSSREPLLPKVETLGPPPTVSVSPPTEASLPVEPIPRDPLFIAPDASGGPFLSRDAAERMAVGGSTALIVRPFLMKESAAQRLLERINGLPLSGIRATITASDRPVWMVVFHTATGPVGSGVAYPRMMLRPALDHFRMLDAVTGAVVSDGNLGKVWPDLLPLLPPETAEDRARDVARGRPFTVTAR